MVPWNPQPYQELNARFPLCLSGMTDVDAVAADPKKYIHDPNRTSNKPEHVFDTFDGFRLIISLDYYEKANERVLHVSMSANSPEAKQKTKEEGKAYARTLYNFKRIAGLKGETHSVGEAFRTFNAGFPVFHLMFRLNRELLDMAGKTTEPPSPQ